MPTIPNTAFSVRFDLTGTPTLKLTDTTTSPPVGLVGIFEITQPDGYVRTGNISSPDIASAGGTFNFTLTLDSSGGVQRGQYTIKYTANAPGYLSTDFTRTFQFTYQPVSLTLREEFDVFTPQLRYYDDTVYTVSTWSNGAVTRAWSGTSTPTGTKTSSGVYLDMIHSGNYYDANYTISLSSTILYTHQTYAWLTTLETISKSVTTYAETPPTVTNLISLIVSLKNTLESKIDTVNEFNQTRQDFEYAQSLFEHIVRRIQVNNMSGIYRDLKDLVAILHNYQIPTYVPTNAIISPYNLGSILFGAIWGNISGSISNQTDLVTYIYNQITALTFATVIGDGMSNTFAVNHYLGAIDIMVEIWDQVTMDQVFADVTILSANTVSVSFANPPAAGQYKVIVKK